MTLKKPTALSAVSVLLAVASLTLGACGSDDASTASEATDGSSAATPSGSPSPSGEAGYDLTFSGDESASGQGSAVSCVAGSWDVFDDPALGDGFGVGGVPDENGDVKAEALTAKWASPKSVYISGSGEGFSVSDDGLTVTLDGVALEGPKGSVEVSGSMTCPG